MVRVALVTYSKPGKPVKVVVLSDLHWAEHDPAALALAEAFLAWYQPDELIHNGDATAGNAVSHWTDLQWTEGRPHLERDEAFWEECQGVTALHARWRKLCKRARMHYIAGNHDEWAATLAARNARGLLPFCNLVDLYGLRSADMTFTPYRRGRDVYGCWVTHGEKSGTAAYMLRKYHRNGLSGHIHRYDLASEPSHGAEPHIWMTTPALCKVTSSYEPEVTSWGQGLAVMEYHPESGRLDREIAHIRNGVLAWRGASWAYQADAAA